MMPLLWKVLINVELTLVGPSLYACPDRRGSIKEIRGSFTAAKHQSSLVDLADMSSLNHWPLFMLWLC